MYKIIIKNVVFMLALAVSVGGCSKKTITEENNEGEDEKTLGYYCQCNLNAEQEASALNMVAPGNRWNIISSRTGYFPSVIDDYTNVVAIGEETTIEGVSYFNLIQTTDSMAGKWESMGYIREDTDAKKVYYRPNGKPERLLYDFMLNEGESISYEYPWFYNPTWKDDLITTVITAEEVTSVLIGGEYKKKITVFVELYRFEEIYSRRRHVWIEGIGADGDFFQDYERDSFVGGYGQGLLCFFQNEKLVYKNIPSEISILTMDLQNISFQNDDCCFFWRSLEYDKGVWKYVEISGKNK